MCGEISQNMGLKAIEKYSDYYKIQIGVGVPMFELFV
jgi:hypothetical protein